MQKKVIIYRDQLLPYSETFIPAQVENFSSYVGFYVGNSRLPSSVSMIPQDRSIILSDLLEFPEAWKTAYKLAGIVHPRWLKRLQDLSPHLIHAHFGLDGVLALPLAKKLKIPLIVTFHGYFATLDLEPSPTFALDFIKRRGQFFRELYVRKRHRLFREAHCFIAVSDFIRSKLIEKGCPPDKIIVHHIGVDVDQFTPDLNIQREPIVLFVGRLVEKKGCEYLIRAIAQVQTVMPNVELVVIGDGPLRSTLEGLAKSSLRHYRFLGVQSPEIIRQWMNRACLLGATSVTTTQGDSEGLPIVILEALAMSLPVVSSVHAGISEAIKQGATGFLADERDWEAVAKFILTLLQDAKLRERFALSGRKHVEQKFNLKINTAILEGLYSKLLHI